jgi:hypothetical protein
MYKTVFEAKTILERVLNSTQYTEVFDDPPEPANQCTKRQQLRILSAIFSPPPPHIEEITKPPKSPNQEPLLEDMPMFILDLFSEEEYIELGHVSNMPKEHKFICSRSEAFIPEATSQIEGLSAIMSREWTEEVESCGSIIQIYRNSRILFCAIRDTFPQEIFYDPKVGVNIMSRTLADHISPEQPLTFSRKHLKWIDGQIMESQGIL